MIVATLILLSSIIFLAKFFKIKFPNSPKKLILLLKSHFYPSPISTMHPNLSPREMPISISMKKDDGMRMKQVFNTFDKNRDGFITRQELSESLKNIGIVVPLKEIDEMVGTLDKNNDGLVDLDEFKKMFDLMEGKMGNFDMEKMCFVDNDDGDGDLKEAFDVFDGDKDGLISVHELGLVLCSLGLKEGKKEEDCKEMIRKVDIDGDGMVNFDEFKMMMKNGIGGVSSLVSSF